MHLFPRSDELTPSASITDDSDDGFPLPSDSAIPAAAHHHGGPNASPLSSSWEIGVVVALLALLILIIGTVLWSRRKRRLLREERAYWHSRRVRDAGTDVGSGTRIGSQLTALEAGAEKDAARAARAGHGTLAGYGYSKETLSRPPPAHAAS
ncbi:hypothetical protein HMN09_00376700 [Mycena chlorophos]|uniref:Uncharacterized protein n=1 Tax=Mycena chlorophos TaxID=658473 RepID=A0A8H6TJX6_MYCCL|nr:hypothetical protein HMN09_00376700 [Mycena chlorophos]